MNLDWLLCGPQIIWIPVSITVIMLIVTLTSKGKTKQFFKEATKLLAIISVVFALLIYAVMQVFPFF